MSKLIALLTDFGSKGQHYVAQMKGVILNINPNVNIIDITHEISPFSIIEAGYIIKTTYKHYPRNSVFIIVVDPGVGSEREILLIKTKSNHFFIGPNNGVLSNALSEEISECILIQNDKFFNKPVSKTFHGRDIMAPVGAYIVKGVSIEEFGPRFNFNNLIKIPLLYEWMESYKAIKCVIQYIDSFGTGITNIPIENSKIKETSIKLNEGDLLKLKVNEQIYECSFISHFSAVPKSTLIALIGSNKFLEISINQGNASKEIGFKVGDIIEIRL